jgi:UDP-2,3-diacylglucosamine hydrolase
VEIPDALGIIAGSGVYPLLLARSARSAGVKRIVAAAFIDESAPSLKEIVDDISWMRVGQLGRLLGFFRGASIHHAMMAGQIAPKNLFDLRPDWKALLVLARLKERNAESIFSAIADELEGIGTKLLPATTFLDQFIAPAGLIAGSKLSLREEEDVRFGWEVAKEISRLNIGQTVVVRNGTVLAVEAFEGTNEALKRGAVLGKKKTTMVKVAKPNQDLRFDVPVVGVETIRLAAQNAVRVIAVEAGKTLLLEKETLINMANRSAISIVAR